jgi:hypothetical protein
MPYISKLLCTAILIASGSFIGGSASAAVVSFPDQTAPTTVDYVSITETNSSADPLFSLFAGVGTSGENLTFDGNNFRLEGSGGIEILDGRMSFEVVADPGFFVTGVRISEFGSSETFGLGSIARAVLVGAVTPEGGSTSPVQQDDHQNDGIANAFNDEGWDLSIAFGFAPVNSVLVDFDNRLSVVEPSRTTSAFIDKKRILIQVRTQVIPEPGHALAFIACGIAGLGVRRRRK